ncbi:MAG: glutamyl-tRNA reductase [Methanomicrobium sp.]|nr:glutamyl-tRNA reductase [Methanomicrobium sp.]
MSTQKQKNELLIPVACAGINHHDAGVEELEAFRFADEKAFLADAGRVFNGVILLQTCNRIEIFVQGTAEELKNYLHSKGKTGFWTLSGKEALNHLLRLASGMDSMIIGEDQILGQLRKALALAQEAGVSSQITDLCINRAVHTGIEVRIQTNINNGAVSIGSAAVQLAEELIGTLAGKRITVVGVGEMGKLVAQALSAKQLIGIYVTNRTFENAKTLAEEIGGKAVLMDKLYDYIALSDVVISCTGAPHYVIHKDKLEEALSKHIWPLEEEKKPIILIDIAQPRDIEEGIAEIDNVKLFTIDDLKTISDKNLDMRRHEAELAERFILEEEKKFISELNRTASNVYLAALHTWADSVRVRERDKALARLAGADDKTKEVFDDFSKVIVKKLLTDLTFAIRGCAERADIATAEKLVLAVTKGEIKDNKGEIKGEIPCFRNEDSED